MGHHKKKKHLREVISVLFQVCIDFITQSNAELLAGGHAYSMASEQHPSTTSHVHLGGPEGHGERQSGGEGVVHPDGGLPLLG